MFVVVGYDYVNPGSALLCHMHYSISPGMHWADSCMSHPVFTGATLVGTYKRLIAVINSWLSDNYHKERDGSNAPSWWKIVDIVADDIGGADPNLAKSIAETWTG